jgi:hypothetical protein
MKNSLGSILFFTPLLVLPTLGAWATNTPSTTINDTEIVTPMRQISPHEAQVMSSNAVSILNHVADARNDIHEKQYSLAKGELNQAQAVLDVVRSQMPVLRIKDRIAIAQKKLNYSSTDDVTADLVPIYGDLSYVEDFVPTQNSKSHLDKAKEHLKKGDKKSAQNELKAAGEAISYSEVDLPLSKTQQNIKTALIALNQNDPNTATKQLALVENNLQINFTTIGEQPDHQKNQINHKRVEKMKQG